MSNYNTETDNHWKLLTSLSKEIAKEFQEASEGFRHHFQANALEHLAEAEAKLLELKKMLRS
jgi:hypothetical protein